jgi:hypothetical protein
MKAGSRGLMVTGFGLRERALAQRIHFLRHSVL